MKILLIEDDNNIVQVATNACKKCGVECVEFIPESFDIIEMRKQINHILELHKFDAVLLDYKLWAQILGEDLMSCFRKKCPVVAFSSSSDYNNELRAKGAIASINKTPMFLVNEDVEKDSENLIKGLIEIIRK